MEEFDERNLPQARDESKVATPASLPMSEIQLRIARENPRDEGAILVRLENELIKYAEYAEEMFYSIAYKDNRNRMINFVEGPSIRASEHIWTRWGNCTVAARVADDRGNKIMVQGMFFDYETGLLNLADLEVLKMGKRKDGGTYPLSGADLQKKVAATESKVKRNAFLGSIPVWIKHRYVDKCFELALGSSDKTIPERIDKSKKFFVEKLKVSPAAATELIDKVRESYPGIADRELLRYLIGIKNAIKDGNAEIDFVFGEEKRSPALPQEKKKAAAPVPAAANVDTDTAIEPE